MANTIGVNVETRVLTGIGDPQQSLGINCPVLFAPDPPAEAPVVDGFVPAPGEIARTQPLRFDVRDDKALAAVTVLVRFEAVPPSTRRPYEVIFDSDGFSDAYRYGGSSVDQLTEKHWQFTVMRAGGWPSAPRLKVIAADGPVAQ